MTEQNEKFASWGVLELMGHRRLGGFVSEATLAGGAFLRIDVPGDVDGEIHSTQFYSPGSVYCLTPCSEDAAKIVARSSRPEPVHQWELPQPRTTTPRVVWDCPGCGGATSQRVCANCEEHHPCSCIPDEDEDRMPMENEDALEVVG